MDNSKLPPKDKDEKSLWETVASWNEKLVRNKRRRGIQRRVKTDAIKGNYKKKKGNQ